MKCILVSRKEIQKGGENWDSSLLLPGGQKDETLKT
jgi:hypothetical protein